MNRSRRLLLFCSALFSAAAVFPLRAAPEAEAAAGRDLVKRYADAVVTVELVVTMKVKSGDREQPPREQRVEVNATVISSSGLVVTSLAQVDPQVAFEAIRANAGGRGPELVGVEFKEVKLRLADGKELAARFVLKDADLDLAFMAPEATDGAKVEFPAYVKLNEAADGAVLGTYYYVSRAPKTLQRVPLVRGTEIMGVVEKPRRFYLMTDQASGAPVFDSKGRVLGVTLQNQSAGRSTWVVLPAADIAEMAKQAAVAQATPPAAPTPAPAAPEATEKKD